MAPQRPGDYAIGNDFEPEPWQKFVEEQEYTDWINVSISRHEYKCQGNIKRSVGKKTSSKKIKF